MKELKRFDDMEFSEVSLRYENFFKKIIKNNKFEEIQNLNEKKYKKLLTFLDKKLKFTNSLGRADLQYGRNMLYGWFLEELFIEV